MKQPKTMQPILEIIELSHTFGGLRALTDFSLQLFPGELVGLIGPNGAGKTTVFNLITGVFRISAGRISFKGEDISAWRSHRITAAGIARTFQNIRLFKELSVMDNVRLGAFAEHRYSLVDALGRSRRFRAAEQGLIHQAFELLERFNLTHYAHTPARHLPYGEQRRLEMARALISRPQVLLLDEPAAGMNQSETEDLIRLIRTLQDEFGLTILLIEHQMRVVVNLCQRVTVLDFGETIAAGSPQEIQRHPAVLEAYLGKDVELSAAGANDTKEAP
jgi:branched-chain amino acid transport system ATP-binding protein